MYIETNRVLNSKEHSNLKYIDHIKYYSLN